MATTKITSNVLALSAAQTNINNDGSFTLSVPTQINNTVALNGAISINTTSYTYGTGSAASHRTALGLDTLFAAKANLAGGNTFTGAQTISGASVTLQNAGAVAFSINETSNTEIPTFNLQQVGTTRGRIEGGVGVTSRMDFSVGSPLSRSMSLNQGGTQNYGVTIGRSSVAANVAPPTDGLHVQGSVGIGTATPTYKLQLSGTSTLGFDTSTSEPSIAGSASGISLKVSGGGTSIFRGIDGWTGTWADLVPTTYFQVGRNFGNTMFSSNAGAQFNRLSFTVANTVNSGVVFTTQTGSLSAPDGYFEIRQGTTSNFLVARTTGNVGIGTTTPNEKLTVVGNISATGIVTAEGNKLAAETFAIAMAIAIG
jgi:hypothetical protein